MSQPDELPRIGAPATRALAAVEITRLSQFTDHRAEEWLHGVGPRAIKIRRQTLADQGLSFRFDT
jgi:hypothetical protein